MKQYFFLAWLFAALSFTGAAQSPSDNEVEIVRVEWRAVMAITSIGGETFTNYIHPPPSSTDLASNEGSNAFFVTHEGQPPAISGRSGYLYRWDLRARLRSRKAVPIRAVEWEYGVKEQGLRKRVFHRRQTLARPTTGEVDLRGRYTPKRTFDNPSSVRPLTLSVEVRKVEYSDGTEWVWK